jgi:hypothetical protein
MNIFQKRKKYRRLSSLLPSRYGDIMEKPTPLKDRIEELEGKRKKTPLDRVLK